MRIEDAEKLPKEELLRRNRIVRYICAVSSPCEDGRILLPEEFRRKSRAVLMLSDKFDLKNPALQAICSAGLLLFPDSFVGSTKQGNPFVFHRAS